MFTASVQKMSQWMQAIAGLALLFIMLLTTADVILRNLLNQPIVGTYELVGLGGAVCIAFAFPITSWMRGHIFVDFLVNMFPKKLKSAVHLATRVLNIAIFLFIAWNLSRYAAKLHSSGEVSLTIQIPFYPVAYGMAACCVLLCLVFIVDICKILGGTYE